MKLLRRGKHTVKLTLHRSSHVEALGARVDNRPRDAQLTRSGVEVLDDGQAVRYSPPAVITVDETPPTVPVGRAAPDPAHSRCT